LSGVWTTVLQSSLMALSFVFLRNTCLHIKVQHRPQPFLWPYTDLVIADILIHAISYSHEHGVPQLAPSLKLRHKRSTFSNFLFSADDQRRHDPHRIHAMNSADRTLVGCHSRYCVIWIVTEPLTLIGFGPSCFYFSQLLTYRTMQQWLLVS
jgi:hypothetical protein